MILIEFKYNEKLKEKMFTWWLLDKNGIVLQKNVYMLFKMYIFFIFIKNKKKISLFSLLQCPLQKVFIPLPSLFTKRHNEWISIS